MRIAILGLGLIGGSLGLALKRSGGDFKIIGIPRRDETLSQAIEIGAVDEGTTDHAKGVAEADVVFICTPINLILPVISEISKNLKKGAIVTDVGSSKQQIVSQAERTLPKGVHFVGGHPMAGKETTKLGAAEEGLFRNQHWILTRTSKTSSKALEEISRLVTLAGARALEMDPRTHDLAVAAISHMPLAAAAALVNAVADEPNSMLMARIAASGFRDATRIASGDPILGVDMFSTNQHSVLKMISALKRSLARMEKLIKEGNGEKIREELERAKRFRDSIYG